MKYRVVNSYGRKMNGQVKRFSPTLQKQLQGNLADEHLWESSKYLVDGVFAALQEMFSNAKRIQVC